MIFTIASLALVLALTAAVGRVCRDPRDDVVARYSAGVPLPWFAPRGE